MCTGQYEDGYVSACLPHDGAWFIYYMRIFKGVSMNTCVGYTCLIENFCNIRHFRVKHDLLVSPYYFRCIHSVPFRPLPRTRLRAVNTQFKSTLCSAFLHSIDLVKGVILPQLVLYWEAEELEKDKWIPSIVAKGLPFDGCPPT